LLDSALPLARRRFVNRCLAQRDLEIDATAISRESRSDESRPAPRLIDCLIVEAIFNARRNVASEQNFEQFDSEEFDDGVPSPVRVEARKSAGRPRVRPEIRSRR
jgi:hypothetical protein